MWGGKKSDFLGFVEFKCDIWVMKCDIWVMKCDIWVMKCDIWVMKCDIFDRYITI